MANLASSSALCLLIILFFSSGSCNANAADSAVASPRKSEPCDPWLGLCPIGSVEEKNRACKKRCVEAFHKDVDGYCTRFPATGGLCFCVACA
ncbi:hypothetical protein ABFX02_01G077000 [Erythranthe guttata]